MEWKKALRTNLKFLSKVRHFCATPQRHDGNSYKLCYKAIFLNYQIA